MARTPCPNANPECKYAPGCFADQHHVYGRGRGQGLGKIAAAFCELPENKEQICRAEHDEINATYVHLPLPDVFTMKQIIEQARNARPDVVA